MTEIEIREANAAEYGAINALAIEAWQILRDGYDPAQWPAMVSAIGGMSKMAANGKLLVAVGDAAILGAVAYVPPGASNPKLFPPGWPTMRMLVVHPANRGRGIGKRLSEACIQLAKDDGAACMGLHTSHIMGVALPMYLRRGFVKDADLDPIAGAAYARYVLRF